LLLLAAVSATDAAATSLQTTDDRDHRYNF